MEPGAAPPRAGPNAAKNAATPSNEQLTKLAKELAQQGWTSVTSIEDNLETKSKGVFKASGPEKPAVAMRVYSLHGSYKPTEVCDEVLHQSSLHHPHIVQPKSLIRTPSFLCIALEYANGGDVFRLARRAGANGLPIPAARFIFQQLVLTLQFAHDFEIFLCHINPSNVLVFWNDRGMPILKIADFRLARLNKPGSSSPRIGTMYTCPQMIRMPEGGDTDSDALSHAADMWAACVTLYFLLYARWPFEKKQIAAWATTERGKWKDDKFVEYPSKQSASGEDVGKQMRDAKDSTYEVVDMLRDVFACGSMSAEDFVLKCPPLDAFVKMAWFVVDLPEGAATMRETYTEKTRERRTSKAYAHLNQLLQNAVSTSVSTLTAKMHDTSLND
eukprot:jgi/Ulvmu1/3938/UM018_0161.1